MPRTGRLHIPGGCYHVIGRGLERRYIFADTEDKRDFLSRFEANLARCQADCLAWALMSNHYHLLIRINHTPLSELMAPLLGGFGGYYNRRHRRSGYVFQNRFRSVLVDADNYLKELVRYIHLNPVRAGMIENVNELESYQWTGHAGVHGRHRQRWHNISAMLGFFGCSQESALLSYGEFLADIKSSDSFTSLSGGGLVRSAGNWEALTNLRREHIVSIGDERILGDASFVERALKQDELKLNFKSHLAESGWSLDRLVREVCTMCSVDERDIKKRTRQKQASAAKSLICYWGTRILGISARKIAAKLEITHTAVSYRVKRGTDYCESNEIEFEDLIR